MTTTENTEKKEEGKKASGHYKSLGRRFAVQFLFQTDFDKSNVSWQIEMFWEQMEENNGKPNRFFRKAKEYAGELIQGSLDNMEKIDTSITGCSDKWDISRIAILDKNIIRVAIYEMLFRPDVPPVVSINEAVEIAKEFGAEKSGLFVNGILNGIKDGLDRPPRKALKTL